MLARDGAVAEGWSQQIFWGCAMSLAAAAAGSQDLWFVSRASGLVLLVLFSVVAARMGSSPKNWPRFVFIELHRTLAAVAVVARIRFAVRGSVVPGTPTATGVPPEIPEDFFSRERAHH